MLSGEGNENDGKTIKDLTLKPKKNNFACAAHFFVHFFAVVLHDFNVKRPETRLVTRSLEEIERLRFTFTPNGKREFAPRDQVFPLFFVYRLLLLHKNK